MAKLLLIRGLPGSGKTTLARKMVAEAKVSADIAIFEADMFFEDANGNYNFSPAKIKDAHEWCQAKTVEYLGYGYDVIVSNTFTQVWEMQFYLDLASPTVEVSVITALGEYKNIHGVPDAALQRMKDRWEDYSPITETA